MDREFADHICNFNRNFNEPKAYHCKYAEWYYNVEHDKPTTYYDSNTGKPLFTAPIGRLFTDF